MPRMHVAAATNNCTQLVQFINEADDINDMTHCVSMSGHNTAYFNKDNTACYMTPLHLAAYNGHIEIVKILIASNAKIDKLSWSATTSIAATAFDIAITRKHYALAKVLHNLGAKDPNKKLDKALANGKVQVKLERAILAGSTQIVLDAFDCDLLTQALKEHLFFFAIKSNSFDLVNELIDFGMHTNLLADNQTVLERALLSCRWRQANPNYIQNLFNKGASIADLKEETVLWLLRFGFAEEFTILLENNLDPKATINKISLLTLSFQNNRDDLAMILIKFGADYKYIDERGRTYLHYCNHITTAALLVSLGVDMDWHDNNGVLASQLVASPVAIFLRQKKQEPALKIIEQYSRHDGISTITPLRKLVIEVDRTGVLDKLQTVLQSELFININEVNTRDQYTALHEAFWWNQGFTVRSPNKTLAEQVADTMHTKAIDLLIAHGAKPFISEASRTPLMNLRCTKNNLTFIILLINRYYKFEADYHKIVPELYRNALREFYNRQYNHICHGNKCMPWEDLVEWFWDTVAPPVHINFVAPS